MLVLVVQERFFNSHSFMYVFPSVPQTGLLVGGHFGH